MLNTPNEPKPTNKSILKKSRQAHDVVIGDLFAKMQDPADKKAWPIIVDPAHEKTMNGKGGMSGAIKAFYEKNGKKKDYIRDLLHFPKVNGVRCPNGDVRRTSTDGVEILHTSAPDLRKKGNMKNGEPTEEAKQKLFNAYYNTFASAGALNRNEGTSRELSCPVLGAGIFKWPMELSAEIAGKALQKFRAEQGNNLQVNFYVHPSALKPGQSAEELKDRLNHNVSTGKPNPSGSTQMQAQLADKEVVQQLIKYVSSVKKDNYDVYKPLAASLQAIADAHESGPKLGAAASALIQATLDKVNADPNFYPKNLAGAIRGNVETAYESVLYKDKVKENKVTFSDTVSVKDDKGEREEKMATKDAHGKADHELVKEGVVKNKKAELPSAEELQNSPMRKVYVCLQASDAKDPTLVAMRKLTNDLAGLTGFEAVSKQQPNHFATTTDPEAIAEWAEQLQEDLKGKPVVIVSMEIPEILLQDGDKLDNRILGDVKKANSDLVKITGLTPAAEFKAAPSEPTQSAPTAQAAQVEQGAPSIVAQSSQPAPLPEQPTQPVPQSAPIPTVAPSQNTPDGKARTLDLLDRLANPENEALSDEAQALYDITQQKPMVRFSQPVPESPQMPPLAPAQNTPNGQARTMDLLDRLANPENEKLSDEAQALYDITQQQPTLEEKAPDINPKIKIEDQEHKTEISNLVALCEDLIFDTMQPLEGEAVDNMMARVGFLRDLNDTIRMFGQGHRTLGDVQKVIADSGLVSDKNANPLQVLADGVESILKETGIQDKKTAQITQIHEIVAQISSEALKVPVNDKPVALSTSASKPAPTVSEPKHAQVSASGMQGIDVQALYNTERENAHKEKTVFHSFARSVVKGFGDLKANDARGNQIANLQELINQYNAPNADKPQAAMQLICALNYVKAEIGAEKNKFSSSLAIVCDNILNKMPQAERDNVKQHFEKMSPGNIQGAINSVGKSAMDNAKPTPRVENSQKQKL